MRPQSFPMVSLAFQKNNCDSCRLPNASLGLKTCFQGFPSVKPFFPMVFLCSAMMEPIADRHFLLLPADRRIVHIHRTGFPCTVFIRSSFGSCF